jgi:hypothetical protein
MQTGPLESQRSCVDKAQQITGLDGSERESPTAKSRLQKLRSISSARPPRENRQALHSIQVAVKLKD